MRYLGLLSCCSKRGVHSQGTSNDTNSYQDDDGVDLLPNNCFDFKCWGYCNTNFLTQCIINPSRCISDVLILPWLTPDNFTYQGKMSRTGKAYGVSIHFLEKYNI